MGIPIVSFFISTFNNCKHLNHHQFGPVWPVWDKRQCDVFFFLSSTGHREAYQTHHISSPPSNHDVSHRARRVTTIGEAHPSTTYRIYEPTWNSSANLLAMLSPLLRQQTKQVSSECKTDEEDRHWIWPGLVTGLSIGNVWVKKYVHRTFLEAKQVLIL